MSDTGQFINKILSIKQLLSNKLKQKQASDKLPEACFYLIHYPLFQKESNCFKSLFFRTSLGTGLVVFPEVTTPFSVCMM